MHKSIQKIPLPTVQMFYSPKNKYKLRVANSISTKHSFDRLTRHRMYTGTCICCVIYSFKNVDGRWISGPRGNFDRNKFQIIPRKTINNTIIDMCDCTITRALRSMKRLRLY